MGKKTLADEIGDFYKPKNDYDIEDFDIGRTQKDLFQHEDKDDIDDESNDDNSDQELKNQHYIETSKSKLRNRQSLDLGKKYTGDVISRDQLYDDSEEDDEEDVDEDEDVDEEEEEEVDEEENINNDSEEEEEDSSEEQESLGSKLSQDSDEDESEVENERPVKSTSSHQRNLVKQLLAKEKKHIVNRLSQSTINDVLKGYAVEQQNKSYEKLVELRIKFQKSVTSMNQLPINSKVYEENKSADSDELLEEAKIQLMEFLRNLLVLRSKLEDTSIKQPKKRSFETFSEVTESADSNLNTQRAVILNKWSSKIQNSSGSSAINNSKFKSINQSFEQQVRNNLSDMDRLVKRTKLNRRQVIPMGYTDEIDEKNDELKDDDDIPIENQIRKKSQGQEIPHIFDDEDFYRILLNDFVDKKIQSSESSHSTSMIKSIQKSNKLKNNVDTKASKGRKLRYHVQDQIANFETSTGGWKWNDDQIDEFFASLLGQKVNMNENDDLENGVEEDEEEIDESNGIRLFG
ncbi:BFR2 [Candida pseudojiufengensis]|uniref:BFR2 n=1 Tax=Candida pseudojiufengensis TaxID=497109 RepID=UPI002225A4F7|nr:BFR2 [Candida pseudojiufengensis]KAI5961894.1 BFR2 [Candida pseudojiufengensis]